MVGHPQRLTKRQKRLSEKGLEKQQTQISKFPTIGQLNLNLRDIQPMTLNQVVAFNAFNQGMNLCLLGCAGTGKTFLSMYLALREIQDKISTKRKLVIIRTAQPSKQIGFLPGTEKQKLEVYEAPYKNICAELYNRGDAYEILKQKGVIDFQSTSFLRGNTLDDAIILVDEVQNLQENEWFTVLTRVGENSRVVVSGDSKQDDVTSERFKEISGISNLRKVLSHMNSFETVEFAPEDIVRSGFVKELILTMYKLNM